MKNFGIRTAHGKHGSVVKRYLASPTPCRRFFLQSQDRAMPPVCVMDVMPMGFFGQMKGRRAKSPAAVIRTNQARLAQLFEHPCYPNRAQAKALGDLLNRLVLGTSGRNM